MSVTVESHAGPQSSELLTRAKPAKQERRTRVMWKKMLTFKFRKEQEYKGSQGRTVGLDTTEGVNFRPAF